MAESAKITRQLKHPDLMRRASRHKLKKVDVFYVLLALCKHHRISFNDGYFAVCNLYKCSWGGWTRDRNGKLVAKVILTTAHLDMSSLLHEFAHVLELRGKAASDIEPGHGSEFIKYFDMLLKNYYKSKYEKHKRNNQKLSS